MTFLRTPDQNICLAWLRRFRPEVVGVIDTSGLSRTPEADADPFQSAEYQAFVESMVPHCRCHAGIRPCDGVLAGGLCDNDQGEREDALPDDFEDEP